LEEDDEKELENLNKKLKKYELINFGDLISSAEKRTMNKLDLIDEGDML
jgi:hypothetical protein